MNYVGATILDIDSHRWYTHVKLQMPDGSEKTITFAGGEEFSGMWSGTKEEYKERVARGLEHITNEQFAESVQRALQVEQTNVAPPSTFREAVLARLPRMVTGDETIVQDAIAMDAILQLAYFGGGDVTIGIGGGHDTIYRAYWGRGGNADGSWETVREALIAAAEQARRGNTPNP